jgi:hypothetical protein
MSISYVDMMNVIRQFPTYIRLETQSNILMFGTNNYGTVVGYRHDSQLRSCINNVNGDPWSVIVAGYTNVVPRYTILRISRTYGVIELNDGNHKIIVDVECQSRFITKNRTDIKTEIETYLERYTAFTGIRGVIVWF